MNRTLSSTAVLLSLCATAASAQTIEMISVSKSVEYVQTDATTVVVNPEAVSDWYSGPYSFEANVNGSGLGGLTAPVLSGPITTTEGVEGLPDAAFVNGGTLIYVDDDSSWSFGSSGDGFATTSATNLNSAFGTGTYTYSLLGGTLDLSLTALDFPTAPVFTLTGGTWDNGKYYVNFDQQLVIETSSFAGYGTSGHAADAVWLEVWGDDYESDNLLYISEGDTPSASATLTIDANTLTAGKTYEVESGFFAATTFGSDDLVPDAMLVAGYESMTRVTIVVTPIPDPEPVTPTIETAIAVRFPTVNGGHYMIEESTNLVDWYIVRPDLYGDGGERTEYFDRHSEQQHYRVTRIYQ